MRLSLTTLFTFMLSVFPFSSQVSAIHPQVLSRREHPSSSLILSSRQHRVPRSILDLCINVNVNLLANASQLGLAPTLGPLDLGSNIHLCLCLKVSIDRFPHKYQALLSPPQDLDIFLNTNIDIKALIELLGKNTVSTLITALVSPILPVSFNLTHFYKKINTSPDTSKCSIPPHGHHICNSHDPCHYECDPHYVRVGDKCVCAPPYISCNGHCDIFPKVSSLFLTHIFGFSLFLSTSITHFNGLAASFSIDIGVTGMWNCCPSLI